ncbi:MAG: methionyl aminopeptidase [Planctomycetota bacterium]
MTGDRRTLRGPQLYTQSDREAAGRAASFARSILDALLVCCRPGALPTDIESNCAGFIGSEGARAMMAGVLNGHGEPFGSACSVSVDDVVAHARPTDKPLRAGQLVTLDLMLELNGWHADVADTVVVGEQQHALMPALDAVWDAAIAKIAPGVRWDRVAEAMANAASVHGAQLVCGLAGHGIGLAPHELPILPLTPDPGEPVPTLRPGMILTLEPAITSGSGETIDSEDGWALRTADGTPSVGREAMIAIEEDGFRVLGGPSPDDSLNA